MSELEKMSEFVNSGQSAVLSDFWDWLEMNGFNLSRWEQRIERKPCRSPLCKDGKITHANPDPRAGWTTAEIPDTVTVDCTHCEGLGFLLKYHAEEETPWLGGPEKLFAMYAGIDLNKLDQERRALLDELRSRDG